MHMLQGQLMQMTMMVTPNFNKELHYLNKEDRLLRWLLVKHRNTNFGVEFLSEYDVRAELSKFPRSTLFGDGEDSDQVKDDDDDDDEYEVYEEDEK